MYALSTKAVLIINELSKIFTTKEIVFFFVNKQFHSAMYVFVGKYSALSTYPHRDKMVLILIFIKVISILFLKNKRFSNKHRYKFYKV